MFEWIQQWFSEHLGTSYFIIGMALIILEMFVPSFVALPLGLGALATIPFSFFLPLSGSFVCWGSFSMVAYWLLKKYSSKSKNELKTGAEGLIGEIGVVIEEIHPNSVVGKVKVYGDEWRVIEAEESMPVGTKVKILAFQGNRVRVEPLWEMEESMHQHFERKLGSPPKPIETSGEENQ